MSESRSSNPPTGVRVFFAGGGTGGHLYPGLAIARALQRVRPDVEPFFIGARRGTGGTEGTSYLRTTLGKRLFPELWEARTMIHQPETNPTVA